MKSDFKSLKSGSVTLSFDMSVNSKVLKIHIKQTVKLRKKASEIESE